jgi:hypothetical protein
MRRDPMDKLEFFNLIRGCFRDDEPKKKTVTFDVIYYEDNEWAILHAYANGDVLGLRLPLTDRDPEREIGAWRMRQFNPKEEVSE